MVAHYCSFQDTRQRLRSLRQAHVTPVNPAPPWYERPYAKRLMRELARRRLEWTLNPRTCMKCGAEFKPVERDMDVCPSCFWKAWERLRED